MTIAAGFKVQDGILLCADTQYTARRSRNQSRKDWGTGRLGDEAKKSSRAATIHTVSSTGAMKVQQQKIFPITITGGSYAFALSGNEVYRKMAIQECQEAIADHPVEERTERAVRRSLAHVVKTFNEEYIDTRPETDREGARFKIKTGPVARVPGSG